VLGSINKEGLLKNKLPKGDLRGAATIRARRGFREDLKE